MVELLLASVLGASAVFSFWWFWKTNPSLRLWWLRTPSSHALALGSAAFLLELPQFSQFAGALLVVTGLGYCVGFSFVHQKSRQKSAQTFRINLLIYAVHFFAGVAGLYLFFRSFSDTENLLLPLAAALLYLGTVGIGFLERKPKNV